MNPSTLRRVAAAALVAATISTSACTATVAPGTTSTSVSPSTSATTPTATTPTPTPTPTLEADQTAALAAAERYESLMAKVRAKPLKYGQYKMIELLKPIAFDDWIQASLNGVQPWRDKGWHEEGAMTVLTRTVGEASPAADSATQVKVSICKDTRDSAVVDKKGNKVKGQQFPAYLKRVYDMRKAKGSDNFKVWEAAGEEVKGCN